MKALLATYLRELRAYFFSPLAYAIGTFVLIINGILFAIIVSFLVDPRSAGGPPFEYFFNMTWIVLLFITPLLTMRLISEERRSGSIEVLMTAPVTETQVVVGKYLAVFTFFFSLWLPTLLFAAIVDHYGDLDWGSVLSGYLGVLGVGALALAIGTLASAFTRSQIVAGVIGFALLFVFFFAFGWMESLSNGELLKALFGHLNVGGPIQDYARGIVGTRSLVYYISATVFFLFLASRVLEAKKWR